MVCVPVNLEGEFGEMGGYEAESNAGTLLSSLGVKEEYHQQPDERYSRKL